MSGLGIVNLKDVEIPFYVNEAIETVKDYLGIQDSTRNIILLAEKLDSVELPDTLADIIMEDISTIPAVSNALSSNSYGNIVEKSILLMLDKLVKEEKIMQYLSTRIEVSEMLAEVENKLWVYLPINLDDKLTKLIVGGKLNITQPTEVPDYTDNVILALTHIENVIKSEYPNINQSELNAVLRRAGINSYDVDSFGETDEDAEEDEFLDEDDDRAKTHKAVRDGKVVVIKKRKKRMNAATKRKISRAMKKVKKIIKPSTIRKMLKSRKIAAKKGLIGD